MLWGASWVNLVMLLATIPQYETDEDPKPGAGASADPDVEVDAETPQDLRDFLNLG